jgi:hypothetical protein
MANTVPATTSCAGIIHPRRRYSTGPMTAVSSTKGSAGVVGVAGPAGWIFPATSNWICALKLSLPVTVPSAAVVTSKVPSGAQSAASVVPVPAASHRSLR